VDVDRVGLELAVLRRTASASISSTSTTVCGRRAAISGSVSLNSRSTARGPSPSMSLGKACGSTSTNVVAPRWDRPSATFCARPWHRVVLPVPGGPDSRINPCGAPLS